MIFEETGGILSDAGREVYNSALGEGLSPIDAWELAMKQSDKLHQKAVETWGSLEQYAMAHGEWSTEIKGISGERTLISSSSSFEVAKGFACSNQSADGIVFEIIIPKSLVLKQPMISSTEFEYLIINGVKP